MEPVYIWFILGVIFIIGEIFTETFYVVCLAFGAFAVFFIEVFSPFSGDEYLTSQQFLIEAVVFVLFSAAAMLFIPKWLKTKNEIKTGLAQSTGETVTIIEKNGVKGVKIQSQFWRISDKNTDLVIGDKRTIEKFEGTKVVLSDK